MSKSKDIIGDVEKHIAKFRLKNVIIEMNNRVLKEGEITNWKADPYYFEFTIKTEKKDADVFKFYYPFDYEFYGDDFNPEMYLDYRIHVLNKNEKLNFDASELRVIKTHKFFDNIVSIKIKEDV